MKRFIILSISLTFINCIVFGQAKGVDAIGFTVKEMDRSVKFYTEVLGFKKISDVEFCNAGLLFRRISSTAE